MNVSNQNIESLISQRAPMLLIDSLVYSDKTTTTSRFRIKEKNIFLTQDRMGEPGLIENIAQTAAAGFGYNRQKDGLSLPTGFLGGIRNLKIHELPKIQSELETTTTVENEVWDMKVVKGEISVDGKCIVECQMKFMIFENEE